MSIGDLQGTWQGIKSMPPPQWMTTDSAGRNGSVV